MNNNIRFEIECNQYVEILLPCDLGDIYRFEEIEIYLNCDSKRCVLYEKDFIFVAIYSLNDLLKKALSNDLFLHESISNDIGYLWNEYLRESSKYNLVDIVSKDGRDRYLVGKNYLLWSSLHDTSTWLCNKNNSIYLEVTPEYKWTFDDPKEDEKYIPYNKWIKNYDPIATIELKREVAQEWLATTEKILFLIDEYDKKNLIIEPEKD